MKNPSNLADDAWLDRFASKDTVSLARFLLGKWLVVEETSQALPITETEAYDGPKDLACHASKGRTQRTEVMFGPHARWYVYLVYGMHEMLNLVTGLPDYPAAILIRAVAGIPGPGRLTKALGIDRRYNASSAGAGAGLRLEDRGLTFEDDEIDVTPRIGIDYAGEDWAQRPYRFVVKKPVEQALLASLPE